MVNALRSQSGFCKWRRRKRLTATRLDVDGGTDVWCVRCAADVNGAFAEKLFVMLACQAHINMGGIGAVRQPSSMLFPS